MTECLPSLGNPEYDNAAEAIACYIAERIDDLLIDSDALSDLVLRIAAANGIDPEPKGYADAPEFEELEGRVQGHVLALVHKLQN